MTLGELITNYRTKHGLSQRKFAEKCNISNGYISMIEKGEHPKTKQPITPTLDKLKSLARGMEMSLQQLCMFVDDIDVSLENDYPQAFSTIVKENFSNHEKEVIAAYRAKPEMQSAVDTLLGVTEQEKIHPKTHERLHKVQIAAQNGKFEEKYMTDKEIQEIMNLPDIPDDDLL